MASCGNLITYWRTNAPQGGLPDHPAHLPSVGEIRGSPVLNGEGLLISVRLAYFSREKIGSICHRQDARHLSHSLRRLAL